MAKTKQFPTPYVEFTEPRANMQDLSGLDNYYQYSKIPGFIDESKNYILGSQFQEVLGQSPFENKQLDGFNLATYNKEAKELPDAYPEPEKEAYRQIWNDLVKGKGKIKEPTFMEKAFKSSMTAGWLRMLGVDDADLFKGFKIDEDGVYYQNKKLKLDPSMEKTINDYSQRTSGNVDSGFWEKTAQTAISLMYDLPLMTLTGQAVSAPLKLMPMVKALMETNQVLPRFVGQALQQTVNFNVLGFPETVESVKNKGMNGGLESIWHQTMMGLGASATGTAGLGMSRAFPKAIMERSPIMREELGALAGSFGFGYGSTKIMGATNEDAISSGLAFAATHFTNPNAYQRIIREQATRNVEVFTEKRADGNQYQSQPDYWIRENGKLYKINTKSFREQGRIEKVDTEGVVPTPEMEKDISYYNMLPENTTILFKDALTKSRVDVRANEILKEIKKDLGDDFKNINADLNPIVHALATTEVTENVGKILSKWRMPDNPELYKKMINITNGKEGFSVSYPMFKRIIKDNMIDYVKDEVRKKQAIELSNMDDNAKKGLLDGLESTRQAFVKEGREKDHTLFYDADVDKLMEYHKLKLGEAREDDLAEIAYRTERIRELDKKLVKLKEEPKKKEYEGPVKIIGEEPKENKVLLAEINRLKENMSAEQKLQANKRALKALEQPEKTTGQALYGKEGTIKKEVKNVTEEKGLQGREEKITNVEKPETIPQAKDVSKVSDKKIEEISQNNEISLPDKPGLKNDSEPYKTISPEDKIEPASSNKEFYPEKIANEPADSPRNKIRESLRNELEKVYNTLSHEDITPEYFIIKRMNDRGMGRVDIAKTLKDLNLKAYEGKTEQQIKDRVANVLKEGTKKLQDQRAKYDDYQGKAKFEIDNKSLPEKEPDVVNEQYLEDKPQQKAIEEMSDEEIYNLERQSRDKNMFDEEDRSDVYEKGQSDEQQSSSTVRLKSGEHGLTKKAEQEHYEKVKRILGLDTNTIDINTKEGQREWNKATARLFNRGDMSDLDMKAYDRIVNELLGLGENPTNKDLEQLYSRKDLPESIKRRYDKSYRQLNADEIKNEVDKLNKHFQEMGNDWYASFDEFLSEKGVVNFNEKVIRLGESATIDTPAHETLHYAVSALGKEKVWNRIFRQEGWDGNGSIMDFKDNPMLRNIHERIAEEYADYRLGLTPDRDGMFSRLSKFFKRVSSWLRGNGWYSKADYFDMLTKGELSARREPISINNLKEYKLYSLQGYSAKHDNQDFKVLNYINKNNDYVEKEKLIDKISSAKVPTSLYSANQAAIKFFRETTTPPAWYTLFSPRFNEIHRSLEEMLVRGVPMVYNQIMKDVEGWDNGKHFRNLSKDDSNGLMSLKEQLKKDIYDGVTPKGISTEDFIRIYGLNDNQAKVVRLYQKTVKKANEIARQGLQDRLIKFNDRLAQTVLSDEDILSFFKEPFWESQIKDANGKIDRVKADEIINADGATKEEIAELVSKRIYPDYKDNYYENDVRPLDKSTWIIEGTRPSTNGNHEQIVDDSGNVLGYQERISTYANDMWNETGTSRRMSDDIKNNIVAGLKKEGYTITKEYKIGDVIKEGNYWERLTANELFNLANAGHIDLNDDVIKRLYDAIKTGTYEQHYTSKNYIPGMYGTQEEYESGLSRFVRNAINSNYRQNSVLDARAKLQLWDKEIKEQNPNKRPANFEENKRDYEYAVKYYNNITHSDENIIDGYKNLVSTFYTALKVSFLTQQSLQGLQTTLHLALADAKNNGWKHFMKGTTDAFGIGLKNIADKKRMSYDFKPLTPEENKMKMMQDLDDAGLMGRTFREELFGVGDDIGSYYKKGLSQATNKAKYMMNLMSANIERFTRVQSFSTFYDIGVEKGLQGKELFNFVSDKIHQSMSQWGVAGRPPIAASKIIGKSQHPGVKALEKSFYTFKTFATHNLGIYEYLMRNKKYGALASKMLFGAGIHGITKFPLMATMFAVANLFTDDDMEHELLDALDELDNKIGVQFGRTLAKGLPSQVGIDMSNLMGESSGFATDLIAESKSRSAEGKLAEVMIGAPYGYSQDAVETANGLYTIFKKQIVDEPWSQEEHDRVEKQLLKMSPLAFRNIMQFAKLERDGFQISGKTIIKPEDLSYRDIWYKALGFNPTTISDATDEQFFGVPAKIKRIQGKINELKKIRSDISKSNLYNPDEKKSELMWIRNKLPELHKELIKLQKQNKR